MAKFYRSESAAAAAAARCGAPNVECVGVRQPDGRWAPAVVLRLDQLWMAEHVKERGVLPLTTQAARAATVPVVDDKRPDGYPAPK